MSQKQGNYSPKKVHGHGSGPAHKVPEVAEQPKIGQSIVRKRKNTVPVQKGENNAKKSQLPNNQKASHASEKQKQRASATNKITGSTSNSTIIAAPAPPKSTIEYKTLNINNLKCGDLVLVLRHYEPSNSHVLHWFIYIHLGDGIGGKIMHAVFCKISNKKDDPFYWAFETMEYNTLNKSNVAYARLIGNISSLNAGNFPHFEQTIRTEVPVPFVKRESSGNPKFNCVIWALSFIHFVVEKEKYFTLPYSVAQLKKEMEEKGNSQARKAWEKCVRTETPYGPRYTYPGYRPLLEYVVVTTA